MPPPPRVVDLRFKGVGDLSSDVGVEGTAVLAHAGGGGLWQDFIGQAGSPVSVGSGVCSTVDCSWDVVVFALPSNVVPLSTSYRTGQISDLPSFLNGGSGDTVVTSLDFEPTAGLFALSEFETGQSGGYYLTQGSVRPSDLQAVASAEGTRKHVITAVTFDAGLVLYLSYSWEHDSTPGYEAKVVPATLSTAGTAAQSLAAEGYIVTAFGGDTADGFLLVGTRVQGDTQPRSVVINSERVQHPSGYAAVGFFLPPSNDGAGTLIFER